MELKSSGKIQGLVIGYFFLVLSCTESQLFVDADSGGLLRTNKDLSVNISLSTNESRSFLLLWTDYPNVTVSLELHSGYRYNVNFTITQTKIWHVGTLYQQVYPANKSELHISSLRLYRKFAAERIYLINLSSNKLVYWLICNNVYTCTLLPPSETPQPRRYEFYLIVFLSGLCAVLIVLILFLGIRHWKTTQFSHIHEKPNWSPLPPPVTRPMMPPPVSNIDLQMMPPTNNKEATFSQNENKYDVLGRHYKVESSRDDIITEENATIAKHDSINSIYYMVTR
ncbi:hypothetical protein SK128_016204 [Halocaridina rubra]|uniref:Fibronectin type-III domain-containing protein n=1 Tax=Halocaridina rubra TaxID=373956 RepID=A0AAN9A6R8_HALRR